MNNSATNVLAAVRVLKALGPEIETLKNEVEKLLTETVFPNGLEFSEDDETQDHELFAAGDGWLLDSWHWTFPAHRRTTGSRARAKVAGELTIAIDLGHSGWLAEQANVPVLFVAWAPKGDSWKGNFNEPDLFPLSSENTQILGSRLVAWYYGDHSSISLEELTMADRAWFYALPLFAIKNRADLEAYVIQPVARLLAGDDLEAIAAALPAFELKHGEKPIQR